MTDKQTDWSDAALDAALADLSADAAAASPRPGPDLVARVLADAATVAATRPAKLMAEAVPSRPTTGGFSFAALFFGWSSGAAAAMAVALVVGISFGSQMDSTDLPMMGSAEAEDEGGIFVADVALFGEDLL